MTAESQLIHPTNRRQIIIAFGADSQVHTNRPRDNIVNQRKLAPGESPGAMTEWFEFRI